MDKKPVSYGKGASMGLKGTQLNIDLLHNLDDILGQPIGHQCIYIYG